MPIENNSIPWWLGPSKAPWEAMLEGVQAGAQIRSNQIRTHQLIAETEQNLLRQETAAAIKMMDLSLEKERNSIAVQAFKAKQDADIMRVKGMAEIGNFVGEATKKGLLTDPETQAGFWKLTSQYAPFVNEQTVNSIWDNTFKSSMDRMARANGQADAPASVAEFEFREMLRKKYQEEQDPKLKQERMDDLRRFEVKAGFTKGDPLEIEEVVSPSGEVHQVLRSPNGRTQLLRPLDESKISTLDLATYKAELGALQDAWKNMDVMVLTDGKPDAAKYQALRDNLYKKFSVKKPSGSGAEPAKTFDFDFDPKTRGLTPVK